MHPDDQGPTNLAWTTAVANKTSYYAEYRILRPDGKWIWGFSKGEPQFDADGNAIAMMGVLGEITERKNIEAELAFERHKLKSVVENSTASIAVLRGKEFIYELTNKSYAELFSNRDLIGKPLLEALPELENQSFPRHAKSALETGVPYIEREALAWLKRTESGPLEERYFDQTYTRILDQNDEPYGIFMHAQEVTDRVMARRKLEEALQAKDDFLSIASHELKTPLTSLKIQAQMHQRLVNRKDPRAYAPEKIDEIMELTDKQVSRLNRLVDDMLDVSRIRTGNLDFNLEQFDFGDLVEEVIQRLQGQFENSSTPLPKLIHKDPSLGNWDRLRLEQVITNLLTNALRYGNQKPIHVLVESNDYLVRLTVIDHGIGVAEDSKERIFNRFERLVNPNEVSGLGLGLFITKQIVTAHKGKLWVESELGKGSRFIVELPQKSISS